MNFQYMGMIVNPAFTLYNESRLVHCTPFGTIFS